MYSARFTFGDLIGEAPTFRACLDSARRAATVELPVLITGESGTGKELLAQAVHNASSRADKPFVGVNVAAIPAELLESELFGYAPGAFTGADRRGSPGRFQLAADGTLLLDEIGEMPLAMQAKLLRVLEDRQVAPLGSRTTRPVNARLIATTNRDLGAMLNRGTFRLDLYHRLRVIPLRLPPLRERPGDIGLLVSHYARLHCAAMGREPIEITPGVLRDLQRFKWPGNVRELANMVAEKITLLAENKGEIDKTPTVVELYLARGNKVGSGPDEEIVPLAELERMAITHALEALDGNIAAVAKALGVSKGTIYNKIKRYGLDA